MMCGSGCLCLSNKVIQDRRINFYPIPIIEKEKPVGEDMGFCYQLTKFGYKIHMDGLVRLEHEIRNRQRPWPRFDNNSQKFKYSDVKDDAVSYRAEPIRRISEIVDEIKSCQCLIGSVVFVWPACEERCKTAWL
jgi:hypothetical protein